ncbi:endonuclease/exonuclease/phosphatase family protein [Rhizobium sp. CF122]|uniref:endonuclease/exonuclease/phosphatase family protein n=1 Tax=Rhizobium sp. CF122 TaxID=1144312 RepID=UPI001FCC3E19|nr:endonuclease/exonuclease/phosphatase family protein [Rhizobium sp. CF122]
MANVRFQALPAIVCGDLNAIPSSPAYKSLATHFCDAQLLAQTKPRPTYPSRYPLLRIDHVFVSKDLQVASVAITADRLARRRPTICRFW